MRRLAPAFLLLALAACAQEPSLRNVQLAGPTEAAFSRRPPARPVQNRNCQMPALDNPARLMRMMEGGGEFPARAPEIVIFDCAPRRTAWR